MGTRTIGIAVQLNATGGERVKIMFQEPNQALSYYRIIKNSRHLADLKVEPCLEKDERTVSLRLPGRVSEVVASTTYGGFVFMFNDTDLKNFWLKHVPFWKQGAQDEALYVHWDIPKKQLDAQLGIISPSEVKHKRAESPGRAFTSATMPKPR